MVDTLLIAGGGTGGHIFSGIAVAQSWVEHGGKVVFVGTHRGQEGKIVPEYGFELRFIKVGRFKGGSILNKLWTLLGLPFAMIRACQILKREKPVAVLGIGGYASGPTIMAAWMMGLYTAVLDQNVHPGLTNRILGKIVKKVFVSFPATKKFFSKKKTSLTGNPVRTKVQCSDYKVPTNDFCLFVFGGSQGASVLNQKFLEAAARLPNLWQEFEIYHQAGVNDIEKIKIFYKENRIRATVSSFFDNINEIYEKAHLVICRAGAGTVTELAMSGRPAILIPYPFAADDHQKKNADFFVQAHAAWMIEQRNLTGERLAEKIYSLRKHPQELEAYAHAMKQLAKPDAAKAIVGALLQKGEDLKH